MPRSQVTELRPQTIAFALGSQLESILRKQTLTHSDQLSNIGLALVSLDYTP